MFTTLALSTMLLAYPAPAERAPPDKGPGYLGITFHAAEGEGGVEVAEIRPDGPAMGSGLRANDIIRKFNGEEIVFQSFPSKIVRMRPGTIVPLEVQRGSERLTIKVRLGVRPEDFPFPLPETNELPDLPEPAVPDMEKK